MHNHNVHWYGFYNVPRLRYYLATIAPEAQFDSATKRMQREQVGDSFPLIHWYATVSNVNQWLRITVWWIFPGAFWRFWPGLDFDISSD